MIEEVRTGSKHGYAAGPERYFNRELSWLGFNRRVLALAQDPGLPLLERVRFVAICSRNLDEFFQVRVAGLKEQVELGVEDKSADGLTAREQLSAIRERVDEQLAELDKVLLKELAPSLREHGGGWVGWDSLTKPERKHLAQTFNKRILPVLTPLSVDPSHPFPYISNLSLNLAVVIRDPESGEERFARLKVPTLLPRFTRLPDGVRCVPTDQVIAAHLDTLFPGMEILSHASFRVTLDAEIHIEAGDSEDLRAAIATGLSKRLRMNDAVRLEVDRSMSAQLRSLLARELELEADDVYRPKSLLALDSLDELCDMPNSDLLYPAWNPVTPRRLATNPDESGTSDIFAAIKAGDILVHHPYDSFRASVQSFLTQAATDPQVLAIKHTVYRTSYSEDNPVTRALMRAAQMGKEVVALIELQARFDEESNIEWAKSLGEAGVHVVYGLPGLKTHGKLALVVRQEGERIQRYCHVGTGNYNPQTARIYEDVGLLSASEDLCEDAARLFNHLTGYARPTRYERLLVAPGTLRSSFVALIREQAKRQKGEVVMKMNSLSDPALIEELYEASRGGVKIDLIVRGICCLRPGVPGLSENIRVRSIVGRFLEHSRLYRFGPLDDDPAYYMSSADMMTRNLDRRVEVAARIDDARLKQRIEEILQVNLDPASEAWELDGSGSWRRTQTSGSSASDSTSESRVGPSTNTHERFQELARLRASSEEPLEPRT